VAAFWIEINNPAKAWDDWMLRGKEPQPIEANATCKGKVQVDSVTAFAKSINVVMAPTTIFADGSRAAGALTGDVLRTRFASAASKPIQVAKSN
jgi:hypothetical protein